MELAGKPPEPIPSVPASPFSPGSPGGPIGPGLPGIPGSPCKVKIFQISKQKRGMVKLHFTVNPGGP